MAKPAKTQWDFGELFPPDQFRQVLTVTQLTVQIRRLLEQQLGRVWVSGEISNLRLQPSGHLYFSLKDAGAQLSCVLFRGELEVDRTVLEDGQKVVVQGDLTVYEPRGQYQLRVTALELQGIGALQAAFEKLKQKLKAEGLFASERKRPLSRFPRRIGVVTSPSGAALRDVLHVIQRRNPTLEILLAPSRVQGEGAAAEIAASIRLLNEFNRQKSRDLGLELAVPGARGYLDLILVTRGGGSLEDLWAFNEEVVARAIFESEIPVVSAVGHEIDFTISDFVADLRAATPSAAAEILTEGVVSSCQFVTQAADRLGQLARQQLEAKAELLEAQRQRLARVHPRRRLQDWSQRLDDLQSTLRRCARVGTRQHRQACQPLLDRLSRVRPAVLLRLRQELFQQANERFREQAHHRLRERRDRLDALCGRLSLLGPEQVLARGYSITTDLNTGRVLRDAKSVQPGQQLKTRLQSGEVRSRAE